MTDTRQASIAAQLPEARPTAINDAPTILQVLPSLVTGGVERGTVDVAGAVVAAGWRAIVASAGGPMVRELIRVGASHIELPLDTKNPLRLHRNVERLVAVIRQHGVDLVHARSRAPAWSAYLAARRAGVRFVTTFHGTYNFRTPAKRLYNSIMVRGDRVIAISDFIAEHMRRHYRFDPDKLRVIHRGIDTEQFDPRRVSGERIVRLARHWRLPEDMRVVMLPGRLTHWKGQKVLIEALGLLGRRDLRCLLVGADQGRAAYMKELERQIHAMGLDGVVQLTGDCRDMPAALKLADVVVSASTDPEAFGRIAVEAQAMGKPVIATDHGATRETILPGQTGWLIAPGDAAALARALEAALALTPPQREALATAAIENVRRRFAKAAMCDATLAVYRELLAPAAAIAAPGRSR